MPQLGAHRPIAVVLTSAFILLPYCIETVWAQPKNPPPPPTWPDIWQQIVRRRDQEKPRTARIIPDPSVVRPTPPVIAPPSPAYPGTSPAGATTPPVTPPAPPPTPPVVERSAPIVPPVTPSDFPSAQPIVRPIPAVSPATSKSPIDPPMVTPVAPGRIVECYFGPPSKPVCSVMPQLIERRVIWRDRPIFLWQGKAERVTVSEMKDVQKPIWTQENLGNANSVVYAGKPLKPGAQYIWKVKVGMQSLPVAFQVMEKTERKRITTQLMQLETQMNAQKLSPEARLKQRVQFFLDQNLFLDAIQELYTLPQPSPELKAIQRQLVELSCNEQANSPSVQDVK